MKIKSIAETILSLGGILNDEYTTCYGCTKCQKWHYPTDPQFVLHTGFQSKHGAKIIKRIAREETK